MGDISPLTPFFFWKKKLISFVNIMDNLEKASSKGARPLEIEEPVNITIETRQQTEEKQKKTEKRIPTPKQIEQLKKAREAKAIKKKAIEMMEITSTPKEYNENNTDYTQYIIPLACVLGSVGGFYFLKKKILSQPTTNSNNNSHYTQEPQEKYSKLQLNF